MAQFRVGQRVRIKDTSRTPGHPVSALVGSSGTIKSIETDTWNAPINVRCDAAGPLNSAGMCLWSFWPDELAPLLPPDDAADAFIARIKKLGSEPINDAPKERMTINGDVGNGG